MRKIILLLLSLVSFYSFGFTQDSSKVKSWSISFASCRYFPPQESEMPTFRIRCGYLTSTEPLYVIDSVIASKSELRSIDPDNIDSIWIIKGAKATALFGSKGINGVVVIATKKTKEKIIEVRDKATGELLPFATVEITRIGKWRKDRFRADSLGQVIIRTVSEDGYELLVSHARYSDFKGLIATRKKEDKRVIYLANTENSLDQLETLRKIKVYPNPAVHSSDITVEFESKNENKIRLALFSINSKLISSNDFKLKVGINKLTHFINAKLASGIYIVQLIDENNKLIKTEKLIIQ